jgi:hypothetical protein
LLKAIGGEYTEQAEPAEALFVRDAPAGDLLETLQQHGSSMLLEDALRDWQR